MKTITKTPYEKAILSSMKDFIKIAGKFAWFHAYMGAMMQMRANIQYKGDMRGTGGDTSAGVYMVRIPKTLMDDYRYTEIPAHVYDIFVKYKVKIA